jgi:HK97 family phage major capsid protein
VPIELDRNILALERNLVVMRRIATVISLGTPNYTKLVNLRGATSGWVGEVDARPETNTPQFATLAPFWGELYANPGVSQTMLDDAFYDVEGELANDLSIEFAEQENKKFLIGDGVKSPKGLLAYATALTADATRAFGTLQHLVTGVAATFVTASATASPADVLIDMQQALKPGYRNAAKWLMNSATVGILRKVKNLEGDYIWKAGMLEGQAATILGKPVEEDENMPAVGAGALAIAYGDFKRGYTICDRIGTRVLRDPFSHKPFIHFYTTKRVGGMLTDSQAVKILKVSI